MYIIHALLNRQYEYDTFVRHPEMLILNVLAGISNKYQKGYCYPSQDKICERLRSVYGRHMSLRSLNRHLSQLVRVGFLKRQRRHVHDAARGWTFRSTVYKLKGRALKYLRGMAGPVNRAMSFDRTSRVPNSAQHSYTIRIIPEAHPKSGCAPPGSFTECSADEPGGTEDKEKTVGLNEICKIKALLRG
jgi:hypothetical protein